MKLTKHLERLLLFVGFGPLAFCAAAKIHEVQSDRSGSSSAAGPVKAVEPSGEAVEVAECMTL